MHKTLKLTMTAMIIAIGTLTSHILYIPLGFTKLFPIQHFLNVLTAVLLGPWYAVMQALIISIFRNIMGTGSIFAFPGSIIGAFLASLLYKKTKKLFISCLGEIVGTGIIGAMVCYPIATLLLGQNVALFGFIPSFIFSSFTGAVIGFIILSVVMKNSAIQSFQQQSNKK